MGNKRLMDRQKVLCDEVSRDGTVVYVAIGKKYAGYIVIADSVKEDARRPPILEGKRSARRY